MQIIKNTIRLLRVGLYLLLFSFLSVNLHANSQAGISKQNKGLSISKKLTIKELFKYIEQQTPYTFFYNSNLKALDKKVSLHVKDFEISEILNVSFKKLPLEYQIDGYKILVRNKVATQTNINTPKPPIEIKGIVTDENGEPLPGATILIVGTTQGTATDFDGNFSISVDQGAFLNISFMGYESQKIKVHDQRFLQIKLMPSSNVLEEVIIAGVAAGTSKKKMSVSVSKVKSDDIAKVPQSSVSTALQSKVAGVNITSFNGSPGSGANIVLRNATNLAGSNSPLILIDGVIVTTSLADINADDIQDIEIVKGAAASSLYGSKAGNGVIVITSKRGKNLTEGQTNISLRSRIGFQQVSKYLELSESHPYELAFDWLDAETYTKYNFVDYPADYVTGYDPRISGNRVIKEDAYMDLPYRVNNNLQDEMFTEGLSITNYASVGHKSKDTNIFMSYEYNEDEGIVIETGGYRRNSIRANIDHSINDKVFLSASNNYIDTSNDFVGGGNSFGAFFDVLMMEPDVDLFRDNPDGQKYNYYPSHWNLLVNNPLYNLWKKESGSTKNKFLGSYNLKWVMKDWVNFETSYAFEYQGYENKYYTPQGTYSGFEQQSSGSLSRKKSKIFNKNIRATLNFSQSWGKLDFKGKLSYLLEDNFFESTIVEGSNFILPNMPTLDYFDQGDFNANDYTSTIKAVNYFAIGSFVYNDRYIFDGLYRKDGSSLFGKNVRWQDYFRASAAYRISKDIKIPGIKELKLRAAYGSSGQRPDFADQYETFTNNDGVFYPYQLGNINLKPSYSLEKEIGLDASFLKYFYLEANYSKTVTRDQYLSAPQAAPFGGFSFQKINAGTFESETIEAMLKSKLIDKNDLKWDISLTFDKSNSKITELKIPEYSTGPRSAFKIREGEEYGVMYGYDFVRTLDQMEQQLPDGMDISDYSVNRDGIVVLTNDIGTVNEKAFILLDENGNKKNVIIGNITPDFRMGLNSSFTYKNLTLYTLWKWKKGGDLYNGTAQYLVRDLRHPMMDQMYTKPEDKKTVNYYQSLYDAQSVNRFWVEDASYIRLNEASIYYNFNGKSLKGINKYFKNIKLGIIGNNLLTFTKYTGYDPEAGYSGFLFDNYGYPNFRSYAMSLEFNL